MDGITGLNYTNVLGVINSLPEFIDLIFFPEKFVDFPYGKKLRVKKDKHNLLQEIGAIERGFLSAVQEKRNKK
jgi:hypothetical protein